MFGDVDNQRDLPSGQRAERRGDELMDRGNDTERSPEYRDDMYGIAQRYFAWCACDDKRDEAGRAIAQLQPELEAAREQRRQQAERARADFEKQRESMQKSIDDMQKTEAERKSFEEEAADLEAELGF